jgi:hypothetical protein
MAALLGQLLAVVNAISLPEGPGQILPDRPLRRLAEDSATARDSPPDWAYVFAIPAFDRSRGRDSSFASTTRLPMP